MSSDRITIVDEHDHVIGAETRATARAQGLRHRIVRVFVINAAGEILLQRRAEHLQDTPGKWDQSVGGHVDAGEDYLTAARRETTEELGIMPTRFDIIGRFYIERPGPGGTIRRFQTIFTAHWDGPVSADPAEVAEVRWLAPAAIGAMLQHHPDAFTKNFAKSFSLLLQFLEVKTRSKH